MPITATTTITVMATRTNTVWIPGAVTPYPSAVIPTNNENFTSTVSGDATATETLWISSFETASSWETIATQLSSGSLSATASVSSLDQGEPTDTLTLAGTSSTTSAASEATSTGTDESSLASSVPSVTAPDTSAGAIASETVSSWNSMSSASDSTQSLSQTISGSLSSETITSEPTTAISSTTSAQTDTATGPASETMVASPGLDEASSVFESLVAGSPSTAGATEASGPTASLTSLVPSLAETASSSESLSSATATSYTPNWTAPGDVPDYPPSASITTSQTLQTGVVSEAMSQSGPLDSAVSTASSTATEASMTYLPDWEAPASVPLYPSATTASTESNAESMTATVTSTELNSSETQTKPTQFSSAVESASSSATSWWSSWWSQSSSVDTATPTATTSAATDVLTTSEAVSASETASLESLVSTASTTTLEASVSSASETATTSSAVPVPARGSTLSTAILPRTMTSGYYPDWSVWTYPVSQIDWSKLDLVEFAFAIPNSDFDLVFTQDNSLDTLKQLVTAGQAAGKKVSLSIGGWTGSTYFSPAVSTEEARQTFADNIAKVYNSYNLDGINIDNEYWGARGADGNLWSADDSEKFLEFLKLLRRTLPPQAIISAATQVWPFAGPDGNPLKDVSEYAQYLDHITIMNYDVFSVGEPGVNAPLSNGCNSDAMPLANAYSAVNSWTNAGMPADQIMLGIAAYGYLYKSNASRLRTRRRGLEPDVTVRNPNGDDAGGQVNFATLIAQGALKRDDQTGQWVGAGGFTREWDDCSSTPWLKSWASGQIISYDDPDSISLKAQFSRQAGLRGASMWEITGDMGQAEGSLLAATRSGLGL